MSKSRNSETQKKIFVGEVLRASLKFDSGGEICISQEIQKLKKNFVGEVFRASLKFGSDGEICESQVTQ